MPSHDNNGRDGDALRTALRVAGVYLFLGVVWILASDAALEILAPDEAVFRTFSSVKGVVYVLVTAAVGFGIALRIIRRREVAEAEARESEGAYRRVFDAVNDAIFVHDVETGRIVDANRRTVELYGWSVDELRTLSPAAACEGSPPFTEEEARARMRRAVEDGPQLFEWHARRKDGRTFWVDVHLHRARIGGEDRVLAIVRDIDARKRTEADEAALAERLQETQRLESLGVLAGGLAHDFNNLLTAILGNAELLEARVADDPDAGELLEQVRQSSRRAAELTSQLLAYAGRGRFVTASVHVDAMVREMARLLRNTVGPDVALDLAVDGGPLGVDGDGGQLRQVVANLVLNAGEAVAGRAGRVRVHVARRRVDRNWLAGCRIGADLPAGEYAAIEVSDDGPGMDADVLQRVFEPFFTTKFTGRGLGLSAVLGIVRGHGGALHVESAPGEGTTFTVLLPIAAAPDAVAPPPRDAAATDLTNGVALVVDDERTVRRLVERLVRREGLDVITAADGEEALARYAERADEIRVVVLDQTMPRMDGFATFRALRERDEALPVLLMTGFDARETAARLDGAADTAFLQKPFTADALREQLRGLLATRS